MVNGIKTSDPHRLNKGCGSKFRVGSWVWRTPEEGRRTYRPKRCEYNNKDVDNSPKTLNDKNQQASSQKFRQLISNVVLFPTLLWWARIIEPKSDDIGTRPILTFRCYNSRNKIKSCENFAFLPGLLTRGGPEKEDFRCLVGDVSN